MKLYIRAFSLPRKKAIEKLDGPSMKLDEHITKCVIYGEYQNESFKHWSHEIATWLQSCDGSNISGANLKVKDYQDSLFGHFGTTISDAYDNLNYFQANNPDKHHSGSHSNPLPYFRINDDMVKCLYDCYNDIVDICIPILQASKVHPVSFWDSLVRSILSAHIYKLTDEDILH